VADAVNAIKSNILDKIDKDMFEKLAILARDLIWKRTKDGYGVNDDTADLPVKKKLKELSAAYKKKRKGMTLGEFGTTNKSNLTLTGQMLNAITHKTFSDGLLLTIKASARKDGGPNNQELAGYVSEKGRPFFALTDKEQKQIVKEFQRLVRELIV